MNTQCPRCLSSSFKPVMTDFGKGCEFCKDSTVMRTSGLTDSTHYVSVKPLASDNVIPLHGSHATRAAE